MADYDHRFPKYPGAYKYVAAILWPLVAIGVFIVYLNNK
jgi:hypothetical protein